MPLSLVGGVRSLENMETVISAGIDCVSLGRALIAEPDFVKKALAGGGESICVSCSRCFVLPHMHPGIRCIWIWKKKTRPSEKGRSPVVSWIGPRCKNILKCISLVYKLTTI